jgi:hypothetical protein
MDQLRGPVKNVKNSTLQLHGSTENNAILVSGDALDHAAAVTAVQQVAIGTFRT